MGAFRGAQVREVVGLGALAARNRAIASQYFADLVRSASLHPTLRTPRLCIALPTPAPVSGHVPQRACAPEGRVYRPAAPTHLRRRLLGLQYTLHEERSVTQSPPTESQLLSSGSCSSAGAGAAAAGRGNRLVVKINFTTLDATGATGRPPGAGASV